LSARRAALKSPVTTDDNMFLECADASGADYLITGNQRHFPRFWKKTKFITTREFISLAAPHLIK
jgi:predicted nucleic acid-binding protein